MVGRNKFQSSKIEIMKMWCRIISHASQVDLLATQFAVENSSSALKMCASDLPGLLLLRERQLQALIWNL
jgi:hypothetical protein